MSSDRATSDTDNRPIAIRRALISVYDKTGIVDFSRALHDEFGVEIISTGGTAKTLSEAGIPVTLVEDITGFPEMLDGRVKTLHPCIHAAILADRDNPEHMKQLAEQGIEPIDMVVVNLYPFEKTIAKPDCTFEEAIEMIDIGGPCLLRAAAKNHKHVLIVEDDPEQYDNVLQVLRGEYILPDNDRDDRRYRAACAFGLISTYDAQISEWIGKQKGLTHIPWLTSIFLLNWGALRYGENPHQRAELLESVEDSPLCLPTSDGSWEDSADISFNNYADASAALELCAELTCAAAEPAGSRYHKEGTKLRMWYRLPAGSGVPPASSRPAEQLPPNRIQGETQSRRYLPHIQNPGRSYFVTFRTLEVHLPPEARSLVLAACRHWHGRKMTLHVVVVMPDHVHMLLTPWLYADGSAVPLAELTHSIKSFSANQVNRLVGRKGALWMQERWDRIMRHEREFGETWDYMQTNPERAGLREGYEWAWVSETGFEEGGWVEQRGEDRLEAGGTQNRLEADTTLSDVDTTVTGATSVAACCFIKHTNACGTAVDADPIEAYRRAYLGDPNAAMGGVLAVNFKVDAAFAAAVMETYQRWGKPLKEAGHPAPPGAFFLEVWVAESFDEEAVRIIRGEKEGGPQKAWGKRVRLLDVGDMLAEPDADEMDIKRIAGGVLMQTRDLLGLNEDQWKVVSKRTPTEAEMNDLRLAWLVCKHTKSNAISICKNGMLIGNGAGQMSRVMSCRIATWLATENGHADALKGAVAASDAFFPFRDGPEILIDAGVSALIQPGGSKRDGDTISACDERDVAMVFTGTRHFKH